MSLNLFRLRVPVGAFPYPAKERNFAAEVCDLLNTIVVLIDSTNVTASPSKLGSSLRDGLRRMTSGGIVFLIPFRDIGGRCDE